MKCRRRKVKIFHAFHAWHFHVQRYRGEIIQPLLSKSSRRPSFSDLKKNGAVGYTYFRVRTFHPMQFYLLPFQPLTISSYCISKFLQFRPTPILADWS